MTDFKKAFAAHRPDLLRHCYRMLGSFADAEDLVQEVLLRAWRSRSSYAGEAPIDHWLLRIATNACLTALATPQRRRSLPQVARGPASADRIGQSYNTLELADWVTPAPDALLLANPPKDSAAALETRESVALAFIALLQRLPPRQRAVLLLKDVIGWSSEEIAAALDLTLASVSSALHRARQTVAQRPGAPASAAPPKILREYVRSWEEHDVEALVALLRSDVVFAMPPHATWFRGAATVGRFVRSPRFSAFWATGLQVRLTRANGLDALAFFLRTRRGAYRRHSLQVVRFIGGRLAEATTFIGADYLHAFAVPRRLAGSAALGPRR